MRIALHAHRRPIAWLGLLLLLAAAPPHSHSPPGAATTARGGGDAELDAPGEAGSGHPAPTRLVLDAGSCSLCRAGEDHPADRVRPPITLAAIGRAAALQAHRAGLPASPQLCLRAARAPPLHSLA